ncbi:hypothetical protein HPB48_000358 [Haemaphysalis longicornis]|uniref:Uncharacterized protein n=1 Tax=Haemaphysalis longicornis TaxID=44386 RepID=A0A9J6GHR7_HAELO|nr:hypothetical protein HPB48_000358 [Haemaphysalis longicornis]
MTPVGRCTARITIGDANFVGSFVVLAECCKDLILRMDFLREYNAVIDVGERLIIHSCRTTTYHNSQHAERSCGLSTKT